MNNTRGMTHSSSQADGPVVYSTHPAGKGRLLHKNHVIENSGPVMIGLNTNCAKIKVDMTYII